MNNTTTAKNIIKTLITTTAKTIKYTTKAIKLFYNTLTKDNNKPKHKYKPNTCQKCGNPSGKHKLCYQCYRQQLHQNHLKAKQHHQTPY